MSETPPLAYFWGEDAFMVERAARTYTERISPPGEPMEVFVSPLLLCVGAELSGRRFGIRYALHGQNLRAPAKGQLKLRFVQGRR